MAKKVVAAFQTSGGKDFTKVIRMQSRGRPALMFLKKTLFPMML